MLHRKCSRLAVSFDTWISFRVLFLPRSFSLTFRKWHLTVDLYSNGKSPWPPLEKVVCHVPRGITAYQPGILHYSLRNQLIKKNWRKKISTVWKRSTFFNDIPKKRLHRIAAEERKFAKFRAKLSDIQIEVRNRGILKDVKEKWENPEWQVKGRETNLSYTT